MPPYVPSAAAQAMALAAGTNMANLASPVTAWQTAIAGGALTPAAIYDAILATTPTFIDVASGIGFTGTWVNFGATAGEGAAYLKTLTGIVHLKGLIKSGTIGTGAFTLPVGYRPIGRRQFVTNTSPNVYGLLEIAGTGVVTPQVGSNTYFFLDCCFVAEQ